jgi:hypothetical protein
LPGRERISLIPGETSHAETSVSPPRALVETNGAPLSHWIARGVPYSVLEHSADACAAAAGQEPHCQYEAAVRVADCKRLALVSVAGPPPALEVHRPEIARTGDLDVRTTVNGPDAHR